MRREASGNADAAAWASSSALLALGGGVAAWLLWQRSGRGRMRGAGRAAWAPVLRLSSQALTPQASVHAVQWQGEEFLLGCTAQQVTLLCRKPAVTDAEPER
jgi:flagellar biogenesis protein FliO